MYRNKSPSETHDSLKGNKRRPKVLVALPSSCILLVCGLPFAAAPPSPDRCGTLENTKNP